MHHVLAHAAGQDIEKTRKKIKIKKVFRLSLDGYVTFLKGFVQKNELLQNMTGWLLEYSLTKILLVILLECPEFKKQCIS